MIMPVSRRTRDVYLIIVREINIFIQLEVSRVAHCGLALRGHVNLPGHQGTSGTLVSVVDSQGSVCKSQPFMEPRCSPFLVRGSRFLAAKSPSLYTTRSGEVSILASKEMLAPRRKTQCLIFTPSPSLPYTSLLSISTCPVHISHLRPSSVHTAPSQQSRTPQTQNGRTCTRSLYRPLKMRFVAPFLALFAVVATAQQNAINIPLGGLQVAANIPTTITWSNPSR